jgi:hypothetical protein
MIVKELQILGQEVIAIETDVSKPINTAVMFRNPIEHYGHLGFISSYPGSESSERFLEIEALRYPLIRFRSTALGHNS